MMVGTGQSRKKVKTERSILILLHSSFVVRILYSIIKHPYPPYQTGKLKIAYCLGSLIKEMWLASLRPLPTTSKFRCSNVFGSKSRQCLPRAVNVKLEPLVRMQSSHTLAERELRSLLPTMEELGLREGDHGMYAKYLN